MITTCTAMSSRLGLAVTKFVGGPMEISLAALRILGEGMVCWRFAQSLYLDDAACLTIGLITLGGVLDVVCW